MKDLVIIAAETALTEKRDKDVLVSIHWLQLFETMF